jgi:hypothetical protein
MLHYLLRMRTCHTNTVSWPFFAFVAPAAGLLVCFRAAGQSAPDSGWTSLFNGTDLTGWYAVVGSGPRDNDSNHIFQVTDGSIHVYKDAEDASKQPFGYVITEKEYSDYDLRFQYKWGEKKFKPRAGATHRRDAGCLVQMVGKDGVWPTSVECQVMEDDTGDIFTVHTRVATTVDPATTNIITTVTTNSTTHAVRTNSAVEPVFLEASAGGVPFVQGDPGPSKRIRHGAKYDTRDGWNDVEVIVRGNTATFIVNGHVNNRLTDLEQMVDGKWVPLTKGKILFQAEGAEVYYRNIEIKPLESRF